MHDVLSGDFRNLAPRETGEYLFAEISAVHLDRAWLPDPFMPAECRFGNGLEDRLLGLRRHGCVLPDRGQHRGRARTCLAYAQVVCITDDLPDAPPVVLAVDEVAPASRRQHTDTEAFQLGVADVAGGHTGSERPDSGLGEGFSRHRTVLLYSCSREQRTGKSLPEVAD